MNSSSDLKDDGKQMATENANINMPQDIIINILKRLPVKTILQCQSVCKDWKNLFKTPCFIKEHYQHSADKNPLLIFSPLNPRIFSSLALLRYETKSWEDEMILIEDMVGLLRPHGYEIIGSCTFFICLLLYRYPPSLLLLNPATKEVRQIPKSLINNDDDYCCISNFGIGFSALVNDYKIVRVHTTKNFMLRRAEVFSLRAGSWKEVESDNILKCVSIDIEVEPTTAFGVIYWFGWMAGVIVSFDLALECFRLIPLPTSIVDDTHGTSTTKLGEYQDNVAMSKGYRDHNSSKVDLWVLEEGNGTCGKSWYWTKKYSIGPISCFLYPLCFWRNEIVCVRLRSGLPAEHDAPFIDLVILTTNNELKKFKISLTSLYVPKLFNYVESLALLPGI